MTTIRRTVLAAALLAAGCASAPPAAPQTTAETCAAPHDDDALMALDYQAFDQDLTPGGWRALADVPGCKRAAADVIVEWRALHGEGLDEGARTTLWFHQGQLLLMAGDYPGAIPAFEHAYKDETENPPPPDAPADDVAAWRAILDVGNAFVDAHIAYARRDRAALQAARDRMAAIPEPPGYDEMAANIPPGIPPEAFAWPLNLDDVDRMLACFYAPYGQTCEAAGGR